MAARQLAKHLLQALQKALHTRGHMANKEQEATERVRRLKSLALFVADMHDTLELPKNLAKGSWEHETMASLLVKLGAEVGELAMAIDNAESPARVLAECTDVANCAMMIADKVRNWPA